MSVLHTLIEAGGTQLAYLHGSLSPRLWNEVGWRGCTTIDESVNDVVSRCFLFDCPVMGVSVIDPGTDVAATFLEAACMAVSWFSRSQLLRMQVSHLPWRDADGCALCSDDSIVRRILETGRDEAYAMCNTRK